MDSASAAPENIDVIILGAGGAGMMCAIEAGKRWRTVLIIDHSKKPGGKITISGGGRCNFTNRGAGPANYVCRNPHFVKSALSRYPSSRFIELIEQHRIPYHERKHGQLFFDESAQVLVDLLRKECDEANVRFLLETSIEKVSRLPENSAPRRFRVETSRGAFESESLVVATGGLSIPKIGATGFGHGLARQFGLAVTDLAPALDGFTFSEEQTRLYRELAGISLEVVMSCNGKSFREALLFTHTGLSGPTSLQCSLHWHPGDEVIIRWLPDLNLFEWLMGKKRSGSRAVVKNLMSELLPARLAERLCELHLPVAQGALPLPQVSERALEAFCQALEAWRIRPSGTVGYNKAEVTRGGVDTDELSSKTLEARKVPGLFFIGEVVDVTGWLGGYNYQWAWASGWAAGQAV